MLFAQEPALQLAVRPPGGSSWRRSTFEDLPAQLRLGVGSWEWVLSGPGMATLRGTAQLEPGEALVLGP